MTVSHGFLEVACFLHEFRKITWVCVWNLYPLTDYPWHMIDNEKYLHTGLSVTVFKVLLQLLDNTHRTFLSFSKIKTSTLLQQSIPGEWTIQSISLYNTKPIFLFFSPLWFLFRRLNHFCTDSINASFRYVHIEDDGMVNFIFPHTIS